MKRVSDLAKDSTTTRRSMSCTIDRCRRAQALSGAIEHAEVTELLSLLADDDPMVRWEAGLALAEVVRAIGGPRRRFPAILSRTTHAPRTRDVMGPIEEWLCSDDAERRLTATDALGFWPHDRAVTLLLGMLTDPVPLVRASAAASLGRIGDHRAFHALMGALDDPSIWVRRSAAIALGAIGDLAAVPHLVDAARTGDAPVAQGAILALSHLPCAQSRRLLSQVAQGEDAMMRGYAIRALGDIGTVGSLSALAANREQDAIFHGDTLANLAIEAEQKIRRRERGLLNQTLKLVYHISEALQAACRWVASLRTWQRIPLRGAVRRISFRLPWRRDSRERTDR